MKPHRSPLLLAALAVATSVLAPGLGRAQTVEEFRQWKDKSGRTLEAAMTGVDTATASVKMKRRDGTEVSVPIALLSPEDVAFARAKWQEMQAQPTAAMTPAAAPGAAPAPAPALAAAPTGQAAPPRPTLTVTPVAKFKVPAAADYLRTVARTRPRLIHAQAGWDYVTNLTKTDATATALLAKLNESGQKLLETPELTRIYGEQRSRVTPGSKAIYRVATLGTLHQIEKDPRWLDRGIREVVALCDPASFSDWYPTQPNVTADFLIATSLGYDWFHAGFNKQQVEKIRGYLVNQGIIPLAAFLDKKEADKATADLPPDVEEFGAAAALLIGALCLADEEPAAAKQAAGAAAKVFGKGMTRFAPGGLWPEGPDAGDRILDYAVLVIQCLKSCSGGDLGFTALEGFVKAGDARLHLNSPIGQVFNYGDSEGQTLTAPWVASWLSGMHGNPGQPAVVAGPAMGPDSAFLGLAGFLLYHNPHAAGHGTPAAADAFFPGAEVAALRSAWNDRAALFVGIKGGDTGNLHSQLDLGSFILDAGGQRWAIELGAEEERAPGMANPADRARRYANYREGTPGQNVLVAGGANQKLDAKALLTATLSTPERGAAVVDLKDAYAQEAKSYERGVMVVRGPKPYALLQDDVSFKGSQKVEWQMHTRATVAVEGNKATLTQGGQTLTAVILSPEGASFTSMEAPEQKEPLRSTKGINVLKVALNEAKGDQRIAVAFALGTEAPQAPVVPLSQWVPKK